MVATFHTSHFLFRAERPLWKPVLRGLVQAPDYCLAASTEIADVAEALAPGSHVEALTNGVDTEIFQPLAPTLPENRTNRIVVPRRLFPKNGVEYLIRAVPEVLARCDGRPIEFMIVGDGPEAARLEALSVELGVADSIQFLGSRPNDEMPGLLSSAAIAVIPSLMEATSVAALEAMACGLPVVASNVGGLPEIVDGEVGALSVPGDPSSLADAISELLGRDDLAAVGARARARVMDLWSVDRLVDRHLEIYRSLLPASVSSEAEQSIGGL